MACYLERIRFQDGSQSILTAVSWRAAVQMLHDLRLIALILAAGVGPIVKPNSIRQRGPDGSFLVDNLLASIFLVHPQNPIRQQI